MIKKAEERNRMTGIGTFLNSGNVRFKGDNKRNEEREANYW